MSDVTDIKKAVKKDEEDTETIDTDDLEKRYREAQKKKAEQRKKDNARVARSYRLPTKK